MGEWGVSSRPSSLAQQSALVTGAAGGIGAAVASALARAGAAVTAFDLDWTRLRHVAAEITAAGHTVTARRLDVTNPWAVEAALALAEAEHGPPDVLVNVAGILHRGSTVSFSEEWWRRLFAVNTDGVFHVSRAAARRMVPRHGGAIITVTSNAAIVPRAQLAGYAASKAAATMFTRCLGLELAAFGIRCNVVAPGSTDTPMLRQAGHDASSAVEGVPEEFRLGIPLGRIASPSDIADAVLFLASDQARHITMHVMPVDGGAGLSA
ncbi:2,3-dihydro-2,3-dihydroxybenzoate dehydrogenase of siderophore biosynthesis [[Actinomadura] parvosata subsp. kistnae]|uniref:2,3-dihydro-2,3-dihydroxybenzoate dehydrogenase n=1 Tax=[Actinomadura] parvosata TaxID=1955412 RepID=UPI000D2988C6|nr:2,3-dihydro-2,3-dihydroxybenzoate dehydrogenase of siderophore biosynthesis [Actinomadura parvosata subsp. kistnae]